MSEPIRAAFADPPYLGLAQKLYGDPTYDRLEAHAELIDRMEREFDAWAYCLHAPALRHILPLCPGNARIMAWVKPFASFKPGVNPAYAWEPVIVRGGRPRGRHEPTVRDWAAVNIALRRGLPGAKPEGFCYWIFEVLNLRDGDDLHDLFPGTGGVTRAWDTWCRQRVLDLGEAYHLAGPR